MFNSIHPIILAALVGGVLALTVLAVAWFNRKAVVKVAALVLALMFLLPAAYVFLGLNPWLIDGRFRTYRAFYQDIEVGMTRDQVFEALVRRYPANGPRMRPKVLNDTQDGLGFFMNPETSREPNCEGIFLTLEAGRVSKKSYSAD